MEAKELVTDFGYTYVNVTCIRLEAELYMSFKDADNVTHIIPFSRLRELIGCSERIIGR